MSEAQDEYNRLMALNGPRAIRHPQDSDSDSSTGSTTLAPSTSAAASQRSAGKYSKDASLRSGGTRFPYTDGPDEDEDDDDHSAELTSQFRPKHSTYYLPHEYQPGAMTGPKGVIADAQALEKEKLGGARDEVNFERTRDLALPRTQKNGGLSPSRKKIGASTEKDIEEDLDEDKDDEEDEGVRQWRERRMRQLRSRQNGSGAHANRRKQQVFGSIRMVDGHGFLEAVEKASRGQVVAVYIYDDQTSLSEAYFTHLTALAQKHPYVHFVAMSHEDAGMEIAGVPAIIGYRNGDKFAAIIPLVDEVPFTCNVVTNLEDALRR